MYVRPIGKAHEPWRIEHVPATSATQADAILRRMGFEMQTGTATRARHAPSQIMPAKAMPLRCASCAFELDGLVIKDGHARCPECGFHQLVVAWTTALETRAEHGALVGCLAIIGALAITLVALMFFLAMFL